MKTVVISAYLCDDSAPFVAAVINMLRCRGGKVDVITELDNTAIIACEKEVTGAEAPLPVVAPPPEVPPPEVSAPLAAADEPAPNVPSTMIIKSLSSDSGIDFTEDANAPHSELFVSNLTPMGEHVSFVYNGLTFKFPVETESMRNSVCNENPQYSNTSIRVRADVQGVDHNIPVLFTLKNTVGASRAVFGKDVATVFNGIREAAKTMEKAPDGTVSA